MNLIESYPDKMYAALVGLGYNAATLDMLFEYLGDLGYTGSLQDRMFDFLISTDKLNITLDEFVAQLDAGTFFSGERSAEIDVPQFNLALLLAVPQVIAQRAALVSMPAFILTTTLTPPTVTAEELGGVTTQTFSEPFTADDGVFSTLAGTPTWSSGRMSFNAVDEGIFKDNDMVRGFVVGITTQISQPAADEFNAINVKILSGANSYEVKFILSVDVEDTAGYFINIEKNGVQIAGSPPIATVLSGINSFTIELVSGGVINVKEESLVWVTATDNTYTTFDEIQIYKGGSTTDTAFVDNVSVSNL